MSFLLKTKKERKSLISIARNAILISMHQAWADCRQRNTQPEEPDFVASLVFNGTRLLEAGWRHILRPYQIQITSVYCHQTPKVNYLGINNSSCELGDMLWCHVHTDRQGASTRNAILYQAKISSHQPYTLPSKEFDQLTLYSSWPEFTYVDSGKISGLKRHIKPAAPKKGAQYLLINNHPPEEPISGLLGIRGTYPIGSCTAENPLFDHSDLGSELVNFIELLSGDPFDDIASASLETGWSRVIWDLLEISLTKAFIRRRSGYFNHPRVYGGSPLNLDGYLSTTGLRPTSVLISILGERDANSLFLRDIQGTALQIRDIQDNEDDGGISIIIIETRELE